MPDWVLELIKSSPAYALLAFLIVSAVRIIPRFIEKMLDTLVRVIEREGAETRKLLNDVFEHQRQFDYAEHESIRTDVRTGRCRYGPTPAPMERVRTPDDQQPYRQKIESRPGEYRVNPKKREGE